MRVATTFLVSVVLALPAGIIHAQTSAPETKLVTLGDQPNAGCPIEFSAQRYGLAVMRNTRQGQGQADNYILSLRLTFDSHKTGAVQRVEVVVHGTTPKAEAMLLSTNQPETASQTFHLSRSDGFFEPTQRVLTRGVPLVTRLELTRVEYTDGSVWRETSGGACSVQPSPMVLVNAEAQ